MFFGSIINCNQCDNISRGARLKTLNKFSQESAVAVAQQTLTNIELKEKRNIISFFFLIFLFSFYFILKDHKEKHTHMYVHIHTESLS